MRKLLDEARPTTKPYGIATDVLKAVDESFFIRNSARSIEAELLSFMRLVQEITKGRTANIMRTMATVNLGDPGRVVREYKERLPSIWRMAKALGYISCKHATIDGCSHQDLTPLARGKRVIKQGALPPDDLMALDIVREDIRDLLYERLEKLEGGKRR